MDISQHSERGRQEDQEFRASLGYTELELRLGHETPSQNKVVISAMLGSRLLFCSHRDLYFPKVLTQESYNHFCLFVCLVLVCFFGTVSSFNPGCP